MCYTRSIDRDNSQRRTNIEIKIQVLKVNLTTKPTAKGSYQEAEVTYKNLGTGKMDSKKIMSFTNKEVFNVVAEAKMDDCFVVNQAKNDKGYWEWQQVKREAPGAIAPTTGNTSTTRSTYETPEERAKKQVYIVRQSSISSAIEYLKGRDGNMITATPDEVLDLATKFTDFVFNGRTFDSPDLFDQPNDLVE